MAAPKDHTTQAQRDFGLDAQAPIDPSPFDGQGPNGEPTPESRALEARGPVPWADRIARAKMKAATASASPNVSGMIGERIDLVGMVVSAMEGTKKYEYNLKATLIRAAGESPLSIYGKAGVESAALIIEELGEGPWPQALPFLVEGVATQWTDGEPTQPKLVPMW